MDFPIILIKAMFLLQYVKAKNVLDCSFEENLCKWKNEDLNEKLNWNLTLLGDTEKTGSTIVAGRGACIGSSYVDSEEKLIKAGLISGLIFKKDNLRCVTFKYRFDGDDSNGLVVLKQILRKRTEHWNSSANKEENMKSLLGQWLLAKVYLEESKEFKIILEGTINIRNPKSKICIDNITSYVKPCNELFVTTPLMPEIFPYYYSWVNIFAGSIFSALTLGCIISISVLVVYVFLTISKQGHKEKRIIRHAGDFSNFERIKYDSHDEIMPGPHLRATTSSHILEPRMLYSSSSKSTNENINEIQESRSNMLARRNRELLSDMVSDDYVDVELSELEALETSNDSIVESYYCKNENEGNQWHQAPIFYQTRTNSQIGMLRNNPFRTQELCEETVFDQNIHIVNNNRAEKTGNDRSFDTAGRPFYPPRYEEAIFVNQPQLQSMNEKPSLLPPRMQTRRNSSQGTIPRSSRQYPMSTFGQPNNNEQFPNDHEQ